MKRYRKKRFKGMIPYGKARFALCRGFFDMIAKAEGRGHFTALEGMEGRAGFNRKPRRAAGQS